MCDPILRRKTPSVSGGGSTFPDSAPTWNEPRIANRKLLILDAAETVNDLRIPPGNQLEQLHGNREGQHSIRVNEQWRICFTWTSAGPKDVAITDYH